ncbi:hypothetical protein J2T17_006365 [Paenibacillus mucilaginosus]
MDAFGIVIKGTLFLLICATLFHLLLWLLLTGIENAGALSKKLLGRIYFLD